MDLEEARKVYPPMWTIYDHPKDQPEKIVVRLWYGEFDSGFAWLWDHVEEARFMIQNAGGCFRIPRSPDDDPVIVETWL